MEILNNIIPAKSINQYEIDWSLNDLLSRIGKNYTKQELDDYILISYQNFKFWILKETGKIDQIGVYGSFKGTFNGIGIGSTLTDIQQKLGTWREGLDVYYLTQFDGICFELADDESEEEWIKENAPIEAIFVYNPKTIDTNAEIIFDTVSKTYMSDYL